MVVVHYGLHSEVVGPCANDSKRMGMDVTVDIKHIVFIVFKLSGEKNVDVNPLSVHEGSH